MSKLLSIRIPDDVHADLAAEAEKRGVSLTAVVVDRLSPRDPEPVGADVPRPRPTLTHGRSRSMVVETKRRAAVADVIDRVGVHIGPVTPAPGALLKRAKVK